MQARFPSSCPVCSQRINVGDDMAKHASGKFVHSWCEAGAIATRATNTYGEPARPEIVTLPAPARQGTFTVPVESSHRTVRVSAVVDGVRFVSLLTGPDRYTCIGLIRDAGFKWTRRFADHDAPAVRAAVATVLTFNEESLERYGKLYAMESGNCWVCGRELTTPESIAAGIGPVCATREAA